MKIEAELKKIIKNALKKLARAEKVTLTKPPEPIIETPKLKEHGDYATNIAMVAASTFGLKPRELAEKLKAIIEGEDWIEGVSVAGPGFINFVLTRSRYLDLLEEIFANGDSYGSLDIGKGTKIQVEFVSANPTGPLHIGHGRGAVYGDALANLLSMAGFDVSKEYYVNDSGVQIDNLGRSVFLRIKELNGEVIKLPEECYQGHYIVDIARRFTESKDYKKFASLGEDEAIAACSRFAADMILEEIKTDLLATGIKHDIYFFESTLHKKNRVDRAIKKLHKGDYVYEKEGAIWFKTTSFGDEKDRVLKKSSGEFTYFAADIAYHLDKFDRGFDRIIDVWGADHAGHVPRMKSAVKAAGYNPDSLDLVLIQLVNLIRKGELVSMSTRAATFETLKDLIDDVGRDVVRYFFLMRSHNAQLDFDLELARKQSPENPVYYIQYAHARISSIFAKALEMGIAYNPKKRDLNLLVLEEESRLARFVGEFPRVIRNAADSLEPHKIAFYLLELAKIFQSYYTKAKSDNRYRVLEGSDARIQTKLYLLKNIQIVIKNGLGILGIEAPDRMEGKEIDGGL